MPRLLNLRVGAGGRFLLGATPFFVAAMVYLTTSEARHALNPNDKILPTIQSIAAAVQRMAFEINAQTGVIPLWADTAASLSRMGLGLSIATLAALTLGLALGLLPLIRASFGPIVAAIAVVPPIAILPILFIVMGLGETSKIALIAIGVGPQMVRDMAAHVAAIPQEQMIKAQTLGASTWQTALRVALPQAMPRLIRCLRLSLGGAWVFLISAEAIASDVGLGYRIFLVRRYLAMDVILPYVVWIALLAVIIDWILSSLSKRAFPWAHERST
jgi:NitT/TauT family transport system permease protein